MARKKRSLKAKAKANASKAQSLLAAPNQHQMQHADYQRDVVMHVETFTRSSVYRVRQQSSLRKMYENGQLTDSQYFAAQEIAHVAERIQRGVGTRCASLEARVDCSGSSHDALIEKLGYVRAEATYTRWRASIAIPRRMIVDMVLEDRGLFATARLYNVGWPRAKRLLLNALTRWNELREKSIRSIDQNDLDVAIAKTS